MENQATKKLIALNYSKTAEAKVTDTSTISVWYGKQQRCFIVVEFRDAVSKEIVGYDVFQPVCTTNSWEWYITSNRNPTSTTTDSTFDRNCGSPAAIDY